MRKRLDYKIEWDYREKVPGITLATLSSGGLKKIKTFTELPGAIKKGESYDVRIKKKFKAS